MTDSRRTVTRRRAESEPRADATSAVTEPTHVLALDGVRGLAIVLVFVRHLALLSWFRESPSALDHFVRSIADIGSYGVDLFFVLSGFLITGILLRERERTVSAAGKFARFYWRRVLRILPLYYVACAILIFVVPQLPYYGKLPEVATLYRYQAWYWFHGVNMLPLVHGAASTPFNSGHFWSLAVEEQFYLVWPLVVLFVSRRTLWKIVVLMIAAAPLVRLACLHWLAPDVGPAAAATLSVARMDVLGFGALLAIASQSPRTTRVVRAAIPWAATATAGSLGIISLSAGSLSVDSRTMLLAGYSAVGLGMCTLIATVLGFGRQAPLARVFSTPGFRTLGKYSYCLYVVHYPLMEPVNLLWTRVHVPALLGSRLAEWIAYAAVLGGLSMAVAMASWRLLEAPLLSFKEWGPFGNRQVTNRALH